MKIIISALNTNEQNMFYKGYGEEKSKKGLGSGALTGTNRVPVFTNSTKKAKEINNFIDAKRIMTEIIDSIKYEEIYNIKMISIHFLESEGVE